MKRIVLLLFIIKFALPVSAQDIPEVVSHKLNTSFASASNIQWNTLSHERYQAHFIQNGIDKSALFSKAGNLLQLMFSVDEKQLPTEVHNTFLNKFPGYEILEAMSVEILGDVFFKIKIGKGKDVFEVDIDIFGKVKRQAKIEVGSESSICEKGDKETYCDRHGKKHKVNHSKKEKHNNGNKKNAEREMSSL